MIIETGFRCHITDFTRATAPTPSGFVTRLRKYLKSRRVTSVVQVGTDRVIEIQFSDGRYRLFLEFYAAGNIVLTDNDLKILALFRIVHEGTAQEGLRVGLTYLLNNRQNYRGGPDLTEERLRNILQGFIDEVDDDMKTPGKNIKTTKNHGLRKALVTSLKEFSPLLIDHALRVSSFDASIKVKDVLIDNTLFSRLLLGLVEAQKIIEDVMKSDLPKGYIIAKTRTSTASSLDEQTRLGLNPDLEKNKSLLYEEYHPFIPQQYLDNSEFKIIELDGFNKTVDEFYSSIEVQHVQSRLAERDENAKRKVEAARQNHEKRLDQLHQTQETHFQKAQALEANLQNVQEAIAAINGLIAQGMGWAEIERLVDMEQAKHNNIAEMIKLPLKLFENTITLLLKPPSFDDEDDFVGNESESSVSDSEADRAETEEAMKTTKLSEHRIAVDVDLGLSPWSNARLYYEQKKTAAIKEQKTLQSSMKALKSTERKINADLSKALKQEKEVLRPARKPFWFEKFIFFISSEGYLVLGGRDMHQNETLYAKHLKKGDVYVHADLSGAASVIVKNKPGLSQSPIPPSTLMEAGTLAVVTSSAWDSKAVMSAWWIPADQVSKTSVTGDYLPAGDFTVFGQKRFLPPAQLLLGFGVMFHISAESKARHFKNRILEETVSKSGDLVREIDVAVAEVREEAKSSGKGNIAMQERSHASPSGLDDHPEASLPEPKSPSKSMSEDKEAQYPNPLDSSILQANVTLAADCDINASREGLASGLEGGSIAALVTDIPLNKQYSDDELGQSENLTKSSSHSPIACHSSAEVDSDGEGHQAVIDNLPTIQNLDRKPRTGVSGSSSTGTRKATAEATPAKQKHPIRGKQGKIKKAKVKYGGQDLEDRVAALRLLGSAAAEAKAEKDALASAAREKELEAQKQRSQKQKILAAEKGKETEKLRQARFQEDHSQSDGEEAEGGLDLETFVGAILPGDEILDAFVMCGPWNAVGTRCRWKAKLQPGAIKKGKVVREILGKWSDDIKELEKKQVRREISEFQVNEDSTELRERELLKSFKEQEIVGVIPVSKCRFMMGAVKTVEGKSKGTSQGRGSSHKHPRAGK